MLEQTMQGSRFEMLQSHFVGGGVSGKPELSK